jgi:hypothetical protein
MLKEFIIVGLFVAIFTIPFAEQRALVNSLQVGRKSEPSTWDCVGCS